MNQIKMGKMMYLHIQEEEIQSPSLKFLNITYILETMNLTIYLLDYLNLDYDIFGLLCDIPASCFLSFLISFISSDT